MRRSDPTKVVMVCRWKGKTDRFFGKYKCFERGKWLHIPGGVFSPAFDTPEKAIVFATTWYQGELARRSAQAVATPPSDPTWDDICDAYIAEVNARTRGKPSTRHEAISFTNASIRKGTLAEGKPADNDETRCLAWLHFIATENIAKKKGKFRKRKPMTVRNIAKHLRYLFKFAIRKKLIPGLAENPMLGDEIKQELHAIVTSEEHRDWLVPRESFVRLVTSASIPVARRITILVLGLSGLRPGELAGLQFRHLVQRGDVCLFSVEQQWTLKRGKKVPAGAATPKTRWAKRMVPLHPALHRPLAQWVTSGWRALVGREPTLDDFVFPGPDGAPFREEKGTVFRADLARAGCPTDYEGVPLRPYALRHLFSTMLAEDGANGTAHDRLLGHRPADTKSLNYTAKLASFLNAELGRIDFELPADAPSFGASQEPVHGDQRGDHAGPVASDRSGLPCR